jgi:hypothetical protein
MFGLTGQATNQVPYPVKIEATLHFSINHVTHKSRLASFFGGGALLERLTLLCGETDGESRFHEKI